MTTGNPFTDARPPSFFRGLISAAAALLLLCLCALLGALLAGATGCASAPPGAWDEATNAAVRAAVAIREAPTNEWWRTFPETEEEYLALCEPKIQEKLLDYPEEERERMYDLLVSEASTAYLFQSIYAAILRNDENPARDEPRDSATGSPGAESGVSSAASGAPPAWDECTLASSWGGNNASVRVMNCLSPGMSDTEFSERIEWTKKQGANTVHLFLINRGDGEKSGYSPWGVGKAPSASACDAKTVAAMKERINRIRADGLAVVIWLQADDSSDWAKALATNADAAVARIAEAGLFEQASTVVLGLEMDEYWSSSEAKTVAAAVRKVYGGKIGTHHTGGRADFVSHGEILFYQVAPGRSAAQIKSDTATAKKHGRPVNFFELDRGPNASLAQAALDAGAFGVGNCAPGVRVPGEGGGTAPTQPASGSTGSDPVLLFKYGGFDGSKAAEDARCRISKLAIGSDSMSFHWDTMIPSDWARGDTKKGPMIIVAAFYQDSSGRWTGGKFDWIDESRPSRSLDNIHGGYGGWDGAAWSAAKKHAVCVVSADGKYRSNLITD